MYACKWLGAIILCLTATLAQGAGIRAIDIPASADGPALKREPCGIPALNRLKRLISARSPCRG